MPKITITVEFSSLEEAQRFLAQSPSTTIAPVHPGVQAMATNLPPAASVALAAATPTPLTTAAPAAATAPPVSAPTQAPAAAAPTTAATSSAVTAPMAPSATPAMGAPVDLRTAARDAMNAWMAKGHDVPAARALMQEVAGVGKLKDATDDKLPALINAFQTRP